MVSIIRSASRTSSGAMSSGHHEPVRVSRWSSANIKDQFPVFDPAIGRTTAIVQGSGVVEVDKAVRAAHDKFEKDWRWRQVSERSRMLDEASRMIRQHADELAQLTAAQTGMLISEARNVDVDECVNSFEYFGGTSISMPNGFVDGGSYHDQILAEPYGVVAVLTGAAWPLLYLGAKLAPALVAGNTVIVKPSCSSALVVTRLIELIAPIFPSGVLQLVLGRGESIGQALVAHPLVSKVSFVGSNQVGQAILHTAADKVIPAVVQLGTRNTVIVFDDADPNRALRAILEGAFANHGESRTALPRVLLQRQIHHRLLPQLARAVRRLKVGDSTNPATHVGPMSSQDRQQQALRYITEACVQGACIVVQAATPKARPLSEGYFVPPTVLDGVRPEMTLSTEAVSGPIACVTSFGSGDEAIALANNSKFGLLAAVFTQNNATAAHLSRRLEVGAVYINNFQRVGYTSMPFSGVKTTGYGREERSIDTLREYTRQRVIRLPTQVETTRYWSVVDEILGG